MRRKPIEHGGGSPGFAIGGSSRKHGVFRKTKMIPRERCRPALCCAIALLAPFLGGATERWSQGIVLLCLAALVFAWPPAARGRVAFAGAALLLIALAVPAFLPASWFGAASWRGQFSGANMQLGPLLSPQPWISAECAALLLAGLLWIYWLSEQEWAPGERRWMAGVFVAGAAGIAVVALAAFHLKKPVPFWHSERGFGPFPNRNQTGDFFAISCILAMACAGEGFRKRNMAALWFALAAVVIGAALVESYSRAAVALFFAGAIAWVVSLGFISRSIKWLALSASLLMALAAAFLLVGGATLQRFEQGGVSWGFRQLIAHDAFSLIRASPWCGIGLGNFEGVFALFRNESALSRSRILHPESDWLWLWSEMGWPAVAAVLGGGAMLFWRVGPLRRGTDRRLRLAAAAAALVFAIHGLVDVPGHRLGSALPGLFMLGLAINDAGPAGEKRHVSSAFRVVAAALGIVGAVWLFDAARGGGLPGRTGVAENTARAQSFVEREDYPGAEAAVTRALAWTPLDWQLYFIRGMALADEGNWPRALDDFRRANLLEPTSPKSTFEEGKIWLNNEPSLAIPAWRETLRRCPPEEAPELYLQMLAYTSAMPDLHRMLHTLAAGRPALEIVYLDHALPGEARDCINTVLQSDPSLRLFDDGEKTAFFRIWAANGGTEELLRRLPDNASWQPFAWRQAAAAFAGRGDFKSACEWAFRYLPRPALPEKLPGDMAALRRRLVSRPDDYAAAYALQAALAGQRDEAGALDVLRSVTGRAGCPAYFRYLEADMAFRLGDSPGAWNALQKYPPLGGN